MFVDRHAATITTADTPLMMMPHAIFDGVDGSRLRERSQPKKPTTTGVLLLTYVPTAEVAAAPVGATSGASSGSQR